jgi:hypothetical protein
LVIIANIERQFLRTDDLKDIQYYFGKHRKKSAMLTHLKIQYFLGMAIGTLFLVYHFMLRVLPGIHEPIRNFEFIRSLPYVLTFAAIAFLWWLRDNRIESYKEFLDNSPGINVDTTGIAYGVGHPTEPLSNQTREHMSSDKPNETQK